ncbi:YybH family protein [Phyllobacterium calauticae]|jgi:uncharacterized protein (TIGR02246 family)|uniref:YybH family protein n=1 Tax=Phyllobacterium calauticae TaxID=2817027 RepID=UPI001CC02B36|nr:SgcJ/EcaC family oxidoreductase [Phyllobacterium calauticae]MBZ3695236.1 SgcJ/EcaC family oxidoreductase [Phyllobacterium calauticae]
MKMSVRTALSSFAVATLAATSAIAQTPQASPAVKAALTKQLDRYEKALNASNLDEVMMLYTDDAVFMPQNFPTQIGRDAVRDTYGKIFQAIKLDVRFGIDEMGEFSDGWAYARTHSKGTATVLANKKQTMEGNQEMFLFRRDNDGTWRFARYIFSSTNPPAQN